MDTSINTISTAQRNGNLFITLQGNYRKEWKSSILEVVGEFEGDGNIFINTEKLSTLLPAARENLRQTFCGISKSRYRIFFLGRKGFDICPDGYRVIVRTKAKCCGKCKTCGCTKKTENQ